MKKVCTENYFISKERAFCVERLREQVGRQANFKRVFLKLHFLTRPAVELKKFLSDRLEILTVSVRLNYLQNQISTESSTEVTRYFSRFCYEKKKIFQSMPFFQKSIFLKTDAYFFRYFYTQKKEFFFVPDLKIRLVAETFHKNGFFEAGIITSFFNIFT